MDIDDRNELNIYIGYAIAFLNVYANVTSLPRLTSNPRIYALECDNEVSRFTRVQFTIHHNTNQPTFFNDVPRVFEEGGQRYYCDHAGIEGRGSDFIRDGDVFFDLTSDDLGIARSKRPLYSAYPEPLPRARVQTSRYIDYINHFRVSLATIANFKRKLDSRGTTCSRIDLPTLSPFSNVVRWTDIILHRPNIVYRVVHQIDLELNPELGGPGYPYSNYIVYKPDGNA